MLLAILRDTKVVIVGAGIAGLSATRDLRRRGWPKERVVLLEASGAVGGRMRTRWHRAGAFIDMGAAYVHGTLGNPIANIAREAGVELKEVSESNPWVECSSAIAFFARGERATDAEVAATNNTYSGLMHRVSEMAQACEDSSYPASDAIEDILLEEPFRSLSARGLARLRLKLLALALWHGCDLEDMQLRSLNFEELEDKPLRGGQGAYGDFPGPHCVVEGGVERIAQAVADSQVQECLRLNTCVRRVSVRPASLGTTPVGAHRDDDSTDGTPGEGGAVVVSCRREVDGGEYVESADHVIVTVPLSLLQQGIVAFDPPISQETKSAMARLTMSTYEKIIVEFAESFWPANVPFIGCCPRVRDMMTTSSVGPRRPVPPVAQGDEIQGAAELGASALPPAMSSDEVVEKRVPASDAAMPEASSPSSILLENGMYSKGIPVLTAAVTGKRSRVVIAALKRAAPESAPTRVSSSSPTGQQERAHGHRDACAREAYDHLVKPALEEAFGELPTPVSVNITSWAIDPLHRGSYTFFPLGAKDDDIYYAGQGAVIGSPGTEFHEEGGQEEVVVGLAAAFAK